MQKTQYSIWCSIAFALLFFKIDKLAMEISTSFDSSVSPPPLLTIASYIVCIYFSASFQGTVKEVPFAQNTDQEVFSTSLSLL